MNTILAVDDDPNIRELVRTALAGAGSTFTVVLPVDASPPGVAEPHAV